MDESFHGHLRMNRIISLPSPGHYAPFNSRMENNNRLVRKFTRPLEERYNAMLNELQHVVIRARLIINEEFPRRMFNGRTSRQIYNAGEDYTESEKGFLIEQIYRKQESIDGLFFLGDAELDKRRKELIEFLQGMNLCRVESSC